MSSIDISGLDKVELLRRLYERSQPAAFFRMSGMSPPSFGTDEPAPHVAVTKYIDYYSGRVIKTDLSKDTIDPYLFDRDNGKGAFAEVVSKMRMSS